MTRDEFLRRRMPAEAKLAAWFILERGGVSVPPRILAESLGLTMTEVINAGRALRRQSLNLSRDDDSIVLPPDPQLVDEMGMARRGGKSKAEGALEEARAQLADLKDEMTLLQMRADRLDTLEQELSGKTEQLKKAHFRINELEQLMRGE